MCAVKYWFVILNMLNREINNMHRISYLVPGCHSGNMAITKTQNEKLSTCEGSRDVVLDLDVDKESRQSERHVALTAQADVMEACRA